MELSKHNVSAKLQKSLTVLHAQSAGEEEVKNKEAMRIAGFATFYAPSAAEHHEQKLLAGRPGFDLQIGAISLRGLPTAGNVRAVEPRLDAV
jgi:hypothetical protein